MRGALPRPRCSASPGTAAASPSADVHCRAWPFEPAVGRPVRRHLEFVRWLGLSSPELLAITKERAAALDEFCAEFGRNPSSIRRQILAGSPATTPDPIWSSVQAFDEWVARWRQVGIDEIVLYFPPELLYEPDLVNPVVLEHLRGLLLARRSGNQSAAVNGQRRATHE